MAAIPTNSGNTMQPSSALFAGEPTLHLGQSCEENNVKIQFPTAIQPIIRICGPSGETVTMDKKTFVNLNRVWPRLKQMMRLKNIPEFSVILHYYFCPKRLLEEIVSVYVHDQRLSFKHSFRDLLNNDEPTSNSVAISKSGGEYEELKKIFSRLSSEIFYKYHQDKDDYTNDSASTISSDSDELEAVTTTHQRNRIILRNRRRCIHRKLRNRQTAGFYLDSNSSSSSSSSSYSDSDLNEFENGDISETKETVSQNCNIANTITRQ